MTHQITRHHAYVSFGLSALLACGPRPEKAGDVCDPDDGCPEGLVCASVLDEHVCHTPPGGTCDPMAPDYCLEDAICEDGACQIPPGGACDPTDPSADDACSGDAVCSDVGLCKIPIGGPCDPAGEDHCVDGSVCGDGSDGGICGIAEGSACEPNEGLCAGGLVCAELEAGGYACYPPVLVKGQVFDSATILGIADAHVLAFDEQTTAITDIAITDDDGNYVLTVPVARDPTGVPVPNASFTLRASASGHQTFPGGLRAALPISASEAVDLEGGWTIQTALTEIALIALPPDQQGLARISGHVLAGNRASGVLIVAEAGGVGVSAVSDLTGAYTIFNVAAGSYAVRGYAADLQLTPVDVEVGGVDVMDADLSLSNAALGTISGSLEIVDAPGDVATSVILVVESTFNDTFVRGEVPRGLRTPRSGLPDVTGAFTITGVPEGRYVVLAAFENDLLVRDPDPNIAGTQIVTIEMPSPGDDVALATSFKITEALSVVYPGAGAAEAVSGPISLRWLDDASETFYTAVVYDAYGERVWCRSDLVMDCDGPNIPGVNGGTEVVVPYEGPLDPGMYYQFRATSWRQPGVKPGPISTTEDLRGVFFVANQ